MSRIKQFEAYSDQDIVSRIVSGEIALYHITDFNRHFYVCGPDEFVASISETLTSLGANSESVVFEK